MKVLNIMSQMPLTANILNDPETIKRHTIYFKDRNYGDYITAPFRSKFSTIGYNTYMSSSSMMRNSKEIMYGPACTQFAISQQHNELMRMIDHSNATVEDGLVEFSKRIYAEDISDIVNRTKAKSIDVLREYFILYGSSNIVLRIIIEELMTEELDSEEHNVDYIEGLLR